MTTDVFEDAPLPLLVVFMAGLVAGGIGFVVFCDWLKDRLSGIPRIPKAQRNLVNAWRLRMIANGRATWKTAPFAGAVATGVRCNIGADR